VIESAIPSLREALGHVPNKIRPHLLCFKMSSVNPSDRLNIGSDPLFYPIVLFVYGGKCQVNHFVGQHPVGGEL
jgi:hypothetical protein